MKKLCIGLLIILMGVIGVLLLLPKQEQKQYSILIDEDHWNVRMVSLMVRQNTIEEQLKERRQELNILDWTVEIPQPESPQVFQNEQNEQILQDEYTLQVEQILQDESYEQDMQEEQEIMVSIDFYEEEQFIIEEIYQLIEQRQQEQIETFENQDIANNVVDYAREWVGVTPYVGWQQRDGNSLIDGTDCSGFVSLVYAQFGVDLPTGSADYQEMSNIGYEDLEPGDVVVYDGGAHVAIYIGDDTVVHCSNPEDGTIESDMWYRQPTGFVHID